MEKFHTYTYGRKLDVESDHKPLEVIIRKPLHKAPKRLQRMLMRAQLTTQDIRITTNTLQEIREHTQKDAVLQELIKVIQTGWPERKAEVTHQISPYFGVRDELSIYEGIVVRGERVVIPMSLRREMMNRLHYAHSGVVSSLSRARESMYWPGISSEVRQFIERCDVCRAFDQKQPKETFMAHEIPDRPWAKVGTDLFSYEGRNYLICVDYYSSFWEVDLLENTKSATIIRKLKAYFARYGIPDTCMSDNGPQYTSEEFKEFSHQWNFQHITSSPTYPQSNGKTEAAVKSAKVLMKKSKKARTDPYLALLVYRNTPTQGLESSPVMRLMSRRTRTQLPTLPVLLEPVVDKNTYQKILENKEKQANQYNKGAKNLEELLTGDTVRLIPPGRSEKQAVKARVSNQLAPRSYEVVTENGASYRRNRRHLRRTKEDFDPECTVPVSTIPERALPELPSTTTAATKPTATPESPATELTATPEIPATKPIAKPAVLARPEATAAQQPTVTRYGRTVRRPKYLTDYQ